MNVGQATSYYNTISNATAPVPASLPAKPTDTQKKTDKELAQVGSEAKAPQQVPQQTTNSRRGSVVNLVV